MRHVFLVSACLAGAVALSACGKQDGEETVERAFQDVNVIDDANLNDVMLTVGDPNEAVTYFKRVTSEQPNNIEFQRGLAQLQIGGSLKNIQILQTREFIGVVQSTSRAVGAQGINLVHARTHRGNHGLHVIEVFPDTLHGRVHRVAELCLPSGIATDRFTQGLNHRAKTGL